MISIYAEENVYYKVNHIILYDDYIKTFVLRNTYTGINQDIDRIEANKLKSEWENNKHDY